MAPEAPTMRLVRTMAGVTLACVLVLAGITVAFAIAGYGRQTLAGFVVTVVGAAFFAALVWGIKHPRESRLKTSLDKWAREHRSAYIVLIVISVVLAVV